MYVNRFKLLNRFIINLVKFIHLLKMFKYICIYTATSVLGATSCHEIARCIVF